MQKKVVTTKKKHSFLPSNYTSPRLLHFKGDGVKDIGADEYTFPTIEEQLKWTKDQYDNALIKSLNWYALTQDDKESAKLAYMALSQGNSRRDIPELLKKSSLPLDRTTCNLLRMAYLGLVLSWRHKKFVAKRIKKSLKAVPVTVEREIGDLSKPSIQDRIEAKLKSTLGEFHLQFDYNLQNGFPEEKSWADINMQILHNPQTGPPGNRYKDLIKLVEPVLAELKLAQSGKDVQLSEAYSLYTKRDMKKMVEWWEQVITDINSFGVTRQSKRKPRKKKQASPEKIISKLKFTKDCPSLKLTSIDPKTILYSTILFVYNIRTRKLGLYVADKRSNAFDVQGTRITNIDVVQSVQKTLRKPEQQLAQFASLGKPAAIKWFESIKTTAIKLKQAVNKDSILVKAFK